jgi:hypothetical protein
MRGYFRQIGWISAGFQGLEGNAVLQAAEKELIPGENREVLTLPPQNGSLSKLF